MPSYTLTIAGRPVSATKTFDVLNPADGTVLAACPEATSSDVTRQSPPREAPSPPGSALVLMQSALQKSQPSPI